jgi:hypothetical protein
MGHKVLIHTLFYENYNYGGMLQAYGLYHALESMGFECEELNYSQSVGNRLKKLIYRWHRVIEIVKDPVYYGKSKKKGLIQRKQRERYIEETDDKLKDAYEAFINKEFSATKLYHPDSVSEINGYDYYIVGGDQVWNPEYADKNFFFTYVSSGKKIGFSCSAGKNNFTNQDKKKIYKYINNMDVVSVRERNFSELLTEGGIDNKIIADPVFLIDKSEWIDFANDKYDLPNQYIFAYILGDDEERREKIKIFAKNNGLPIVSIPHVLRYYIDADEEFADIKIWDAGPREFISLIKNATFILTDSFHGTAFSLILEKQFLNFSRFKTKDKHSLNARLENVVEEYGLETRLVSVEELDKVRIKDIQHIDYEMYKLITENKRRFGLKFLESVLV